MSDWHRRLTDVATAGVPCKPPVNQAHQKLQRPLLAAVTINSRLSYRHLHRRYLELPPAHRRGSTRWSRRRSYTVSTQPRRTCHNAIGGSRRRRSAPPQTLVRWSRTPCTSGCTVDHPHRQRLRPTGRVSAQLPTPCSRTRTICTSGGWSYAHRLDNLGRISIYQTVRQPLVLHNVSEVGIDPCLELLSR